MKLLLPKHFSLESKIGKDYVYQLAFESKEVEVSIKRYSVNRVKGLIAKEVDGSEILITNKEEWLAHTKYDRVLFIQKLEDIFEGNLNTKELKWLKHPNINNSYNCEQVIDSYKNAFIFKKEDLSRKIDGLRAPQIGGVYAALSHWEIGNEVATIVMPTGLGKTETMLSLFISANCKKLLVVVPTVALRSQIFNKFITLGLLKKLGVLNKTSLFPRVGLLTHLASTELEVRNFFSECNVIITTMNIIGRLKDNIQALISSLCSHLFIDEAHHVAAKTWKKFKIAFKGKPILQFTATPYRNDEENIDGKIIFNYPLKKAQEDGYFEKIEFTPIYEYNSNLYDYSIAKKAVEILNSDIANGYNHILMARVNTTARAKEVHEIYKKYIDLNPVQIHTAMSDKENAEARKKILAKEAKIIICVDMLGEGFDLPELKVAAFHDIKKSLPITLQVVGRFTRTSRDRLGKASIVVNLANIEVSEELEQLYSLDANWNYILPNISEEKTREQLSFYNFIKGFEEFPNEIQLQNAKPALSAVVYKNNFASWSPSNFKEGIQGIDNFEQVYSGINFEKKVLVIVTGNKVSVSWGNFKDISQLEWNLYVVYWNQELNLLFINCSANGSLFEDLAKAVTLDKAAPINPVQSK